MEPTKDPTPGPTVEDVNQNKANKLLSFLPIFIAIFGCFVLNLF